MFSPLELEQIEFETKMGGYKKGHVDEVFSIIKNDYDALYKENISLKDKVSMLEELVSKYKSMEEAMNSALTTAQTTADSIIKSANDNADLITETAKQSAKDIKQNAENDINGLLLRREDMKKNLVVFATKNISLLQAQIEILKGMTDEISSVNTVNEE